ncbi:MAG: sigma-70 family RNA polymerase sigma factor [Prevotella sp.]|nr:sigma-70 family RNA polymerase sigma factor [Prevotella sp.]MDY4040211.1 sigma-70 family RNA polymerase sigma factor [Prevotella sp.]
MKQKTTDIERLFRQHYERMYRLARTILYDADECRDVVSDVFERLLREDTVLLPDTEEAYLLRSVRNRCLDIIAHKGVRERVEKMLVMDEETMISDNDDEQLDRLHDIIDHLEPPIRQRILRLRLQQEMTYQEVADAMGVSKVTVYNHLSQATDTIKQIFKQAKQ